MQLMTATPAAPWAKQSKALTGPIPPMATAGTGDRLTMSRSPESPWADLASALVPVGKGGTGTDVIAKGQIGVLQLRHGRNGHTDDGPRPHDPPGQPGRRILLAHVNAVGPHGSGQQHMVVDNKGHPGFPTKPANRLDLIKCIQGKGLVAVLDHGGPGFNGHAHLIQDGETIYPVIGDKIKSKQVSNVVRIHGCLSS
jgi:hypothetical protein